MLVLLASLKKSGTGWLFNMLNDLLVAAGHEDSRAFREEQGYGDVVTGGALCFTHPRWKTLRRLLPLVRRGHTFAISTHAGPNPELLAAMAFGLVKVICLYRDPRDATLSLLDHGARGRARNKKWGELAKIEGVEEAARMMSNRWLRAFSRWLRVPGVLNVRYEDLTRDAPSELRRIADYLSLDVSDEVLGEIVSRYAKKTMAERSEDATAEDWKRFHFNRGVAGRHEDEMTPEERLACEQHLGSYIRRFGYA